MSFIWAGCSLKHGCMFHYHSISIFLSGLNMSIIHVFTIILDVDNGKGKKRKTSDATDSSTVQKGMLWFLLSSTDCLAYGSEHMDCRSFTVLNIGKIFRSLVSARMK